MIGHRRVREVLEADLPPVALLLGPWSVGKRTLGEHLARHHRVQPADRLILPDPLDIAAVRHVIQFVGTAPFGTFKLITGRLDGASTPALNAALKVLEEPPDSARFLLTSTRPTLPTVMSRCRVFQLGQLNPSDLHAILLRQGIPDAKARALSEQHHTGVAPALLAATGDEEKSKSTVLALVQALAGRDRDAFDRVFRVWDDTVGVLFHRWLHEALTGNFSTFTTGDMFGFDRHHDVLTRLIQAVSANPRARSRLGIRAALEPFIAQR